MRRLMIVLGALLALAIGQAVAEGSSALPEQARSFVQSTLKVPVPDRPFIASGLPDCRSTAIMRDHGGRFLCSALAFPDRIEVLPSVMASIQSMRRGDFDFGTVELVLHETLHRPRTRTEPHLEEGIVDALAIDLAPALSRRLGVKQITDGVGFYHREVRAVRIASARATGSSWRSRRARLWRRALWAADDVTRASMYAEAWS